MCRYWHWELPPEETLGTKSWFCCESLIPIFEGGTDLSVLFVVSLRPEKVEKVKWVGDEIMRCLKHLLSLLVIYDCLCPGSPFGPNFAHG